MSVGEVAGELKSTGGQLEIEWEVNFLSLSTEVDKQYNSPVCFFGDTSWCIRMYPNGHSKDSSRGYIALYVMRKDSGFPVTATYSLFVKTTDGREIVERECKDTFKIKDGGFGFSKSFTRSKLIDKESEYMPSGVLKIICSLKFEGERGVKAGEMLRGVLKDSIESTETYTQTEAENEFDRKQLASAVQDTKVLLDFKGLLLSGENCDITLEVKGQKFEAHQAIFGARSSVFASMLSHDMKEKNTGLINIEDCDPEYFPDFLQFLYCGSIECINLQNVCCLYRAAHKYNVEDLKSECLAFMENHFDVDYFCDVITLALQYSETDLVKQATDFFSKNILKIIVTVKWQVFVTENPIESNELTIKALSTHKSLNT